MVIIKIIEIVLMITVVENPIMVCDVIEARAFDEANKIIDIKIAYINSNNDIGNNDKITKPFL